MMHTAKELHAALDRLDRLRERASLRLASAHAARLDAVLDAVDAAELADACIDHAASIFQAERVLSAIHGALDHVRRELHAAERREAAAPLIAANDRS